MQLYSDASASSKISATTSVSSTGHSVVHLFRVVNIGVKPGAASVDIQSIH